MQSLPMLPVRFCPSKETLAVLNDRQWICSFSGGKDSSSLVSWIEWLRRIGLVNCDQPRLVLSDTGVEYPFLTGIAEQMMSSLTRSGWHCEIVRPRINERLYNQIFGRGVTPVHPGGRKMRWCTRATKIDPMKRFAKTIGPDVIQLSGVRWGESSQRDGKLSAGGCAAGGECGLPDPGDGVYGPIITWTTCKVIEWLGGEAGEEVNVVIADLLPIMRQLVDVYEVKRDQQGFWNTPPKVSAMRFGCIGCPAITHEKITTSKAGRKHAEWIHLKRLYELWDLLYAYKNRLIRVKDGKERSGPLKMSARKHYFEVLLDIQKQSGVVLVRPEDIEYIHKCWENSVYPRGWSSADELIDPIDTGLFAKENQ